MLGPPQYKAPEGFLKAASCVPAVLSTRIEDPAGTAMMPGDAASAPSTCPVVTQNSHLYAPVAGLIARTPPAHFLPAMVVLPPATYSVPPSQTAGERVPPPPCGPLPPTATWSFQIGPAAMLVRSQA